MTFNALEECDIDIFLGNWTPLHEPLRNPGVEEGAIDVVTANLKGAAVAPKKGS